VKPVLQRMRERRKGIIMALWAEIFLCMPGSAKARKARNFYIRM